MLSSRGVWGTYPKENSLKMMYLSLILVEFLNINLYIYPVGECTLAKGIQSKNPIYIAIIQLILFTKAQKTSKQNKFIGYLSTMQ